jgi:DNA polymerase-3 subunit delta'
VGKGSFARIAAAELVAEPGVPQPPVEHHPDILIPEYPPATKEDEKKREAGDVYNRKRSIPIDEIRAMQHRLTTRPSLGSRRVVIIDPADDLEKAAVNALLKSLEEPPTGTCFLLVAHQPGRLLPTIRSRCRMLRFAPLADEAIDAILRETEPQADAATRAAAIAAAKGSPAVAMGFVEDELGAVHNLMRRILAEGDASLALRGALCAELGAKPARKRLAAVLELARAVLAGNLRGSSILQQQQIIAAHQALTTLSGQAPTYNFDPGLLGMEIGSLLAAAAMPRETAY